MEIARGLDAVSVTVLSDLPNISTIMSSLTLSNNLHDCEAKFRVFES